MREGDRPAARIRGVVVKAVGDEVLVYDLARHRAHSLNRLAAAIWRGCDGFRNNAAIAAAVGTEIGQPVHEDAVHLALHDLGRAHLLESPGPAKGLTRRELIRRLGAAAAIALPLVSTVAAPTAAEAQSCIPQGAFTCSLVTPPFCCPGLTCTVGGCQPA